MKKALPYIYHILCSIAVMLLLLFVCIYVLKIELKTWHYAILGGLMTLIVPKFKNIETQSGTKLQVIWRFNSLRK
ncbi:hypothetical protein SAMN04488096_107149 [Mesonia phycicola]|uniref:Uncharacterized protein n=1 Tax=Mesonia phycicola TaxID=579105 RepID=A0A1M6G5H5_9FLAO|nr:hypothetical protein [Mesonia phycicola]SHJ05236.1 hypothetical protein SAMN04488096_107149 [Mesonia phycicola]